jgi:hypothetical protein
MPTLTSFSYLPCTLQLLGSPFHSSQDPALYCLPEYFECCRSQSTKMIHCCLYSNQCSCGCVPVVPSGCHTAWGQSCCLEEAELWKALKTRNKRQEFVLFIMNKINCTYIEYFCSDLLWCVTSVTKRNLSYCPLTYSNPFTIQFSQAISCLSLEQKSNISEIISVSVIRKCGGQLWLVSWVSPCEICSGQSGTGTYFS